MDRATSRGDHGSVVSGDGALGLWVTVLWGVVIVAAYGVTLGLVLGITGGLSGPGRANAGLLLSIADICGCAVGVAVMVWVIRRRCRVAAREYLALRTVSWRVMVAWLLAGAVLIAATELVSMWFDRATPASMLQDYRTAIYPWVLWLSVVVGAPLFEELLFRGFLFRGFAATSLGPVGTIIVMAVLWAAMHGQYELFEMAEVMVAGLLWGVARWRTGSVWVPIAMHAFSNVVTSVELVVSNG
jgi:membrane protease YdiL (CAAX protease family)